MNRPLSEFEQRMLGNIERTGCHISIVAPMADEEDGVIFAYSAGFLDTINQPEVIIFGLPRELLGFAINDTLRQCREGVILDEGVELHDILQGHKLVVRRVQPEFIVTDYLNSAIWYEQHRTGQDLTDVVQLVWPGPNDGLFPWDEGCDEAVRALQPALYQPSSVQ